MSEDNCRLLRRDEASEYLEKIHGVSRTPNTLAKYRSLGMGPTITYLGRIPFYRSRHLDEWVREQLTAEPRSLHASHPTAISAT